jgi:hypothetical protein
MVTRTAAVSRQERVIAHFCQMGIFPGGGYSEKVEMFQKEKVERQTKRGSNNCCSDGSRGRMSSGGIEKEDGNPLRVQRQENVGLRTDFKHLDDGEEDKAVGLIHTPVTMVISSSSGSLGWSRSVPSLSHISDSDDKPPPRQLDDASVAYSLDLLVWECECQPIT